MKYFALAAAAVAAAGTLLAAPSATAAPGPDTGSTLLPTSRAPHNSAHAKAPTSPTPTVAYNGACGSGYSAIDSLPLSTLGTVYLTYNSSNGYNCVVTIRSNPGTAMYMAAAIRLAGNSASEVIDEGQYTTYAGPVYLHAAAQCIDWGGQIGTVWDEQDNSHCG